MKPTTRAALRLLLSREWVSGNDIAQVAGYRYSARLDELKALGYTWDKKRVHGSRVPLYRLHPPAPEQMTLGVAS